MGYIFEKEIDQILATVRARTIGEDESITLRQVLNAAIHPALKAYCRAEVEKILEDERATEHRSKRFPYSLSDVISLQKQIDVLLVQHYEFTQDEFERVLDEAVHFEFNYLCRPQWTLLSYVVGDRRRVGMSEVERKLARCVDYHYFPELIRRYSVDRGLAELTYEEFRSLLERIDREVVRRHRADELAGMTRSLVSFVDFGKASPHGSDDQPTLPTNAAIVFFEDKHLDDIKTRLEFERDKNNRAVLTLSELSDILREVRTDPDESARPAEEPTIVEVLEAVAVPSEPPVSEEVRPEAVISSSVETSAEAARPMLPDLQDLFSPSDMKRFVRSIFHKDDAAFRAALDDLNRFTAWDDASHFLDDLFVLQNIDPFSKEAVEFTDRVYGRYFPGGA
ncbi:MAG: hypothetical protein MUE68_09480 [Bacteroidetes bacterium]|nr:hypothetical protein [Bacteroidota bacterium]